MFCQKRNARPRYRNVGRERCEYNACLCVRKTPCQHLTYFHQMHFTGRSWCCRCKDKSAQITRASEGYHRSLFTIRGLRYPIDVKLISVIGSVTFTHREIALFVNPSKFEEGGGAGYGQGRGRGLLFIASISRRCCNTDRFDAKVGNV